MKNIKNIKILKIRYFRYYTHIKAQLFLNELIEIKKHCYFNRAAQL